MGKKLSSDEVAPVIEHASDKAHRITRASLAAIPVFGGSAVEVFNSIIIPPIEKRRAEWMVEVTECINELIDNQHVTLESLHNNEEFMSLLFQASTIALKNHQKEKLDSLKNAIINSAMPNAPDDSLQQMFLNMVDSFTSWHILLLRFLSNPKKCCLNNEDSQIPSSVNSFAKLIEHEFSDLRGKRDFYELIWRDLHSAGLLKTSGLDQPIIEKGSVEKLTNEMGDRLISFISQRP